MVWPSSSTTSGKINIKTIKYGFKIGDASTITAPLTWNGKLWGRTDCNGIQQNFSCATGDCGTGTMSCDGTQVISSATIAEFRAGHGGLHYYNVNGVEGFNSPLAVTPVSPSGEHLNCNSAGCHTSMCPTVEFNCPTQSYKIIFCPVFRLDSATSHLNLIINKIKNKLKVWSKN
jgi:hypothetical protein